MPNLCPNVNNILGPRFTGGIVGQGGGAVASVAPDTYQVAIVADQKTSGTTGGAGTPGSWQTRTLNTIISDVDSIVSLSSNRVTLQAGVYAVRAHGQTVDTLGDQIRLYNYTDSSVLALGSVSYTGATAREAYGIVDCSFELLAAKEIELHQQIASSFSHNWGRPNTFGTQQYATLLIYKVIP